MYTPHALHPWGPRRIAREAAKTKDPGVCIHIIGIDRDMTCCKRHVVHSWGRYCMQANSAAPRPRRVAQDCKWDGYWREIVAETSRRTIKWPILVVTTPRASRRVGMAGSEAMCSGPGVGKKIRKRKRLCNES
jgi:hypothetical protein